jgi:hypothetical protein
MIEHMIAERQSYVAALKSLQAGSGLTQNKQLRSAFSEAISRWDNINRVCTDDGAELASIELAAHTYHERMEHFITWLDSVERSAIMNEVISADRSKIETQLQLQQVGCVCTS